MPAAPPLFSHRPYWAARFGVAPFLPMSRAEMGALGWDSCDIILVTGDAYVDHPSFGMAIIGRLLEAQGFRVGIIAQPDWTSAEPFRALGRPNLFFGVTAGNMDSMVNRYTSDRRLRHNDAYTPNDEGGKRPDRAVIVYSQRCREAYSDAPIVIGGIEASLRRIAHYDYWSDQVRRSILLDARADLLLYGNAERAIVEIAHRAAVGEHPKTIRDVRGTAFVSKGLPEDWLEIDSTELDRPGPVEPHPDPYAVAPTPPHPKPLSRWERGLSSPRPPGEGPGVRAQSSPRPPGEGPGMRADFHPRAKTVIRLPGYEQVRNDPVLYAHASRLLHLETNPGNARALVQRHGDRDLWLNPPPIPLTTPELDAVFGLPYARVPHPSYGGARIPAYEMIRFSVNIMRGCFGGCTFCSITEHEGRIIQSRSEASILREIEDIRDRTPGFTGVISDLGGPTANMYRLACKSREIERSCRKLSCVYPDICSNLNTDHSSLVRLYRKARELPGVKKILIASGVRYDLALRDPAYVRELVTHHVGGYLKIAPEHTETGPLARMMKPGIGAYDKFKELFEKYSKEAGKEQYLIPYFIAAHPGTSDEDMLNLALWLKRNGFRADQVQAFLPSPMALATAMYHSGRNPLHGIHRDRGEIVTSPKGLKQRRLHKAFLRYHDPENWPLLREALRRMGRADLIGNGKRHLIPLWQPPGTGFGGEGARTGRKHGPQTFLTRHTGLPPQSDSSKPFIPSLKKVGNRRDFSKPAAPDRRPARTFTQGSPCGAGKRRGGR
ncbi:MAG TPA: YgiQ family radical SAM protein [Xanthomonadaceae bacterium]|nr:YgiQ family radical SAM protein [Xanthomonadaceae bacterium]